MDKKYISKFINQDFFEYPTKSFKANLNAFKYGVVANTLEFVNPFLIICNKSSKLDKLFISKIITSDFVFLKDSFIQKIYNGTLSEAEKKSLLHAFAILREAFISVVVFPEKNYSIFGECSPIPEEVTEFLFETKLDIKFLNLFGSYFTYPVWAKEPRRYEIKFTQQFSINTKKLSLLSKDERTQILNQYMPSSATTYAVKYPALIRSKNRAENFDTIMYLCPNCGKLFSLYSEFNCLKCKECGSALEFSNNGFILLSSKISNFDDIENFLFEKLRNRSFSTKELVIYPKITLKTRIVDETFHETENCKLSIFADKFTLETFGKSRTVELKDVKDICFDYDNTIKIELEKDEIIISGKHKENLYILRDLHKINK